MGQERLIETAAEYSRGRPALVRVRRRGARCEIDDRGGAVEAAGRPEAAERAAAESGWNAGRNGKVFVIVAADRDIDDLVRRTAEASLAVRDALLALDERLAGSGHRPGWPQTGKSRDRGARSFGA